MGHGFWLVARLLTCGGLSDACRRPSSFSLLWRVLQCGVPFDLLLTLL
jgi:hypothetical protein